MEKEYKQIFCLHIPVRIYEALKKISQETNKTMTEWVIFFIEKGLKELNDNK